jgi:glycosyltransferase involved in cell wall biosynthesis
MKRLLVSSHPAVLGVNRGVYRALARGLAVELAIVAPKRWNADLSVDLHFREEPEDRDLRLHPLPVIGRRLPHNNSLFFYRSQLGRRFRDWRPDVVVAEDEPWSLATLQTFTAFPQSQRAFYTAQNLVMTYPFPFTAIERFVLDRTDVALIRSAECGDVLRPKGYVRPMHFSPHSYDPQSFRPFSPGERAQARESLGLNPSTTLIGYAGRLTAEKGIEDLLKAWALVRPDAKSSANLLFIGNGPGSAAVDIVSSSDRTVSHLPAVPHDMIHQAIGALDALVLPSRTTPGWKEQWGRVLVEAAACGVPLIGSDSGEIPRVIEYLAAGMTVPERDPAARAAAIECFLGSRDTRQEYGAAGAVRAAALFSHDAVAAGLADVFGFRPKEDTVSERAADKTTARRSPA